MTRLDGRRVAIVGRAGSLIGSRNGAKIDAADVVIRVNWVLPVEGPPEDVGTRTDQVWHTGGAKSAIEAAKAHGVPSVRIDIPARAQLARCLYRMGTHPTSGVATVFEVLGHSPASVFVCGFDFFDSGHVQERRPDGMANKTASWVHDPDEDARVMGDLIAGDERVEPDDILRRAIKLRRVRAIRARAVIGEGETLEHPAHLSYTILRATEEDGVLRYPIQIGDDFGRPIAEAERAWEAGHRRYYRGSVWGLHKPLPCVIEIDGDGVAHLLISTARLKYQPEAGQKITINWAP